MRGEDDIHRIVEQLIQKQYGEGTEIDIQNIEKNKDGFNNDIVMFHLKFSHNDDTFFKDMVLKDFSRERYKKGSDITKYSKEIAILGSNAINKSINVPALYFQDEEKRIVFMEKVEGVTLDKWILTNPNHMTAAIEKFGESLAKIHSVKLNSVENYFTDTDVSPNSINAYLDNLRNRIREYNEPEYVPVLDNIAERFRSVLFNQDALNHGDYHFWNVLVTDEQKLFILDWEKASIQDCRFDIANTLILGYSWFGINFKETMLDAYKKVTRNNLEKLDCFEALLSFDSLTKMIPLLQGGDDSHIRERSFEWLKRRYELFVEHNGTRIKQAEDYLRFKGLTFSI